MCFNQDCAPRPEHTRLSSSRSTLQNQMDGKKHGIPHHVYPNPRQTVAIVRMRKQRQQAEILPKIYGGWSKQDYEAKDHILIPIWLIKSTKDTSKTSSPPIKRNPRDIRRIQKLMFAAVHVTRVNLARPHGHQSWCLQVCGCESGIYEKTSMCD